MSAQDKILLTHLTEIVTVDPDRMTSENPLGCIPNGAIGIENEIIAWIGPADEVPGDWQDAEILDQEGLVALPGLIDSHTHPVFAGDRADEFEARLQGKTYLEIAQAGGGILKTVMATRAASFNQLLDLTESRILESMRFGVTTLEAKSGYGLTTASELKSLEVLKSLQEDLPVDIVPTFMGAHDIPPEYKDNVDAFVDLVCEEMIPAVAEQKLARFCDVFCETGYFSVAQSRRILETGMAYGLAPRIHAEEFSDLEGAIMASELGAFSADHLLNLSDKGIRRLAESNTVATLLPGTAFYLRLKEYAPARRLLDAGATVALATDFNPGSCMSQNIQLMMTLGCLQMGMLPHEAIRAVTLNAAKALGLAHDRGSITVGKRADLAFFNVRSYHDILYHYGVNHLTQLWIAGAPVLVYETELHGADPSLN